MRNKKITNKKYKSQYLLLLLFLPILLLLLKYNDFIYEVLFRDNENVTVSQNMQWGVLSINSKKNTYKIGEEIDLSMTVLDESGHMVCDAQVVLGIRNVDTDEETYLSTVDGTILTNAICESHTFTSLPDYYTSFVPEENGKYELSLKVTTEEGEHEIQKEIMVSDTVVYDIEKHIPTRIYPVFSYPVIYEVTPKYSYTGKVVQKMPLEYKIQVSDETVCEFYECNFKEIDTKVEIKEKDEYQEVIWDVNWEAGKTYSLSFTFKTPEHSPEFGLIEPLKIGLWNEFGTWQVAIDTAYDDVVLATNGGPSYRLKFDGNLVESIAAISVSGAPNSYVSTIIPRDSGYCAEYSGAQETVLTNQSNVNTSITYRKIVSMWVEIDTFGTGTGANSRLIWEEGGATNWWSAYTSNGDELRISIGESGSDVGNCVVADLSTGNLYHVVMQWEASTETMELWVDGVKGCTTTTSTAGALSAHTGDWQIGGVSDAYDHTSVKIGQQFDGKIADYSYWAEPTRFLTESEIVNIFVAGSNMPPSPVLNDKPFMSEKTGDSTPEFEFTGIDPDGTADLIYHIMVDDDYDFSSPVINCESDATCTAGAGTFVNTQDGLDTSPFNEGEMINFTPTTTMTSGTTYYWRVRVEGDTASGGAGVYGNWSPRRSFTYISGVGTSSWFQTTDAQFDSNSLSGTETTGTGGVVIAPESYPHVHTESGTIDFALGDLSKTYNLDKAVDNQSKAFILVWGTGPDQDIERVKFRARFNSDSQIEIIRGESGTAAKASWQVIEANDLATNPAFTVQTNEISILSTATTGNATISDVGDVNQATVVVQASCGHSDNTPQVQFRGYLSSTTQVDVARTTSGSACTVRYWVIKWDSSVNVYNGQTVNVGSNNTANIGGTVDLSRSVLFMNWDNDTNGLAQHSTRGHFNSSTQIAFKRETTTGSNTVQWSVVEFPTGAVVQADNGVGSPNVRTSPTVSTSISQVDQAHTFVLHSQQVTGTGSAIVRGQTIAYLTSATQLTFEAQYTGQTNTWSYFVADLSDWTFTVSNPPSTAEYYKSITIDSTKVDSNLTDFPLLISTTSADFKDTANGGYVYQSDGGDIRFTSSDGNTQYDHEIQEYVPSTGKLIAWVKVPSVSSTVDTVLRIYYGSDTAGDQWNPAGVWSAGYQGVWHLSEPSAGSSAVTRNDSTTNANHLTDSGNTPSAAAIVGNGASFNGSSQFLYRTNANQTGLGLINTSFTVSLWHRPDNDGVNGGYISKGNWNDEGGISEYQWGIEHAWYAADGLYSNDWSTTFIRTRSTTGLRQNNWYYITYVHDAVNDEDRMYINGTLETTETSRTVDVGGTSATQFRIGRFNYYTSGLIDETRVASTVKSGAYISASYANQNSPSTFVSFGTQTSVSGGSGATGTVTTVGIDYDWLIGASGWNEFIFTDDETGGDIKYNIQYWNGSSWANTSLINLDTSPVDISSLSPTTHNLIRLVATLTDNGSSPTLYDWEITWTASSNSIPVVSGVTVNGGSLISLTEGSTVSVSWTSTVTDADGHADISSVLGVLYRSGVSGAQGCSVNQNNCYADSSCSLSNCSGSSCTATCTVSMQFFAEPTDSSSPFSAQYWRGWVEATDTQAAVGQGWSASGSPDVASMAALTVTSVINYVPLLPGDDTGSSNETTTITNTGNTVLDLEVSGDNFCTDYPTCSGPQIAVGYQEFNTSTFTYGLGTPLAVSPATVQIGLGKSTINPANSSTSIYWGMGVPNPKEAGSYVGANTVFAVDGT